MVMFMVYTMPATLALRTVLSSYAARRMKINIGQKLEDGSTIRALAHVEVARVAGGWKQVPKVAGHSLGPLAALRNAKYSIKEATLGRSKRIFVALETKEGETVLLLLKEKDFLGRAQDVDVTDTNIMGKHADKNFAASSGSKAATTATTNITRRGENVFRFSPDDAKRLGNHEHFDLTFTDAKASVVQGSESKDSSSDITSPDATSAIEWLDHHLRGETCATVIEGTVVSSESEASDAEAEEPEELPMYGEVKLGAE